MSNPYDTQIGGSHYQVFAVQPCILMNTMTGPAAHILGYIVRTKGADDLDKAIHWCDLAIRGGMQGVTLQLVVDVVVHGEEYEACPNTISATEWCWRNNIPADSYQAQAILALEEGDFQDAKKNIQMMKEEH